MGSNYQNQQNSNEQPWEEEDFAEEMEQLRLYDDEGRFLDCYIEFRLNVQGETYALLRPVDYPVEIFAVVAENDEEETLVPLEEEEIDEVFDTACAILEEQNLTLKRTALTLTVEGELPDLDEDEILMVEVEADDGIEEYQPLGSSFFYGTREYSVYTPLSPTLYVARLVPGQEPELLSPQDFQHLQPLLEQHLVTHLLEEEDWEN
ncbi:DUF1292 and DUF3727 domain protein [Thermosynechococcus sp. NK55a]|jgi:hypothetical protein|uniref:DUF3727 domain-containing protein n=1 Tax=unclassified Thermosynechococcus TaxID=2622553 RepID=UPI0003D7E0CF|nr:MULTISPECIES: DUF3727 domain-containing protein [unclassified Thermosynechococcus]AHB88508.1 DUF1292 and DUF3727 domain protein [Thermosynechococcus sp. NK55a]HIK23478.1 DUF3727 domain-containing protein [Thermosynechococcus sp. M3746_W2019_013]